MNRLVTFVFLVLFVASLGAGLAPHHALSTVSQYTMEPVNGFTGPLATAAYGLKLEEQGWSPVMMGGHDAVGGVDKATIWRRVSGSFVEQQLPDLDPAGPSWVNDVAQSPTSPTRVAIGAATNAADQTKPMLWRSVGSDPWTPVPLPTLGGIQGEGRTCSVVGNAGYFYLTSGWAETITQVRKATVWVPDGGGFTATELPDYGPTFESWVNGAMAIGQMVHLAGAAVDPFGVVVPQLWDLDENYNATRTPLPALAPGENAQATVLGFFDVFVELAGVANDAQGQEQPVVWQYDNGWQIDPLPLPPGDIGGMVKDGTFAEDGTLNLVGYSVTSQGAKRGVMWSGSGSPLVFQPLSLPDAVPPAAPIIPAVATSVDQKGRIAGMGPVVPANITSDDSLVTLQYFLLTPDPATGVGDTPELTPLLYLNVYPSPSQGVTNVLFRPHQPGRGTVAVYDVQGKQVSRLFEGTVRPARMESLSWKGTDRNGKTVPSGVYFVRFTLGRWETSRKVVIAR